MTRLQAFDFGSCYRRFVRNVPAWSRRARLLTPRYYQSSFTADERPRRSRSRVVAARRTHADHGREVGS